MKILIIDDSFSFAKLVKAYLEKHLIFVETSIISSFKELKEKNINEYELFLCDFLLLDAENGEHIKYLVDKDKKVLVITAYEKEFIKFKYSEKVIDCLFKDEYKMKDYLIRLVNRIYKNRNLQILLVDDSVVFRKVGRKFLEMVNFNVIEANNGHEALEILKAYKIDLVVTDLEMPIMDGEKLVIAIREKYSINELPILIMSGKEKEKLIRSLKLGANDFINKNFRKEELLIRIHNMMEMYEHLRKIENQIIIEPLTKVYNRFYLENELEKLFKYYSQKSVAMLDIDFFKKVNDTYGHQTGDEVLKNFANTIKSVVRKSDIIIRYGGEEFLIFMPNTTKYEAMVVVYKIKKTLKVCCGVVNYTFSAGIADEGDTLVEMIKLADKRLYIAKEKRNLIIVK